jgi:hypothetical protein
MAGRWGIRTRRGRASGDGVIDLRERLAPYEVTQGVGSVPSAGHEAVPADAPASGPRHLAGPRHLVR